MLITLVDLGRHLHLKVHIFNKRVKIHSISFGKVLFSFWIPSENSFLRKPWWGLINSSLVGQNSGFAPDVVDSTCSFAIRLSRETSSN
jgi:hypothetical protein